MTQKKPMLSAKKYESATSLLRSQGSTSTVILMLKSYKHTSPLAR